MKTLILDLETFPTEAYVWGLWQQNVNLPAIKEPGSIACWASKWYDEEYVEFSSVHMTKPKYMLEEIWHRLDEADEVVGWNSNSFDLKLLNADFAVAGMGPPSPYKKIDLMRTVKQQMKFLSNKLDFVAGRFGVGHKLPHAGFDMWLGCMEGDPASWKMMQEYNEQDVLLTERMYEKLRPWITSGLNRSAVSLAHVCPYCGGTHLQSRGTTRTTTLTYNRFQCQECGGWSRARLAEKQEATTQLVIAK